jgi:hypothetical protein
MPYKAPADQFTCQFTIRMTRAQHDSVYRLARRRQTSLARLFRESIDILTKAADDRDRVETFMLANGLQPIRRDQKRRRPRNPLLDQPADPTSLPVADLLWHSMRR